MATNDELFAVLKKLVEQELSEQLDRQAKAGVPISHQRALDMANTHVREKLIQRAEQLEKEGNEDSADFNRDLANALPDLMRELGLT